MAVVIVGQEGRHWRGDTTTFMARADKRLAVMSTVYGHARQPRHAWPPLADCVCASDISTHPLISAPTL